MSVIDWSRFTVRISIKETSAEQIYHAWATTAGMEYWFLRFAEYSTPDGTVRGNTELAQPGDNYLWRWHGYSDDVTETGEILDCNGTDFFKFRFGNAGNCSVRIYPEQDEMMVELLQDNIPLDEKSKQQYHVGCHGGWTFYLANMKSMFEGGIDLRNKNEHIQHVINS
nr:SRPBCC domain-containing protein [uncultured Lacibacter sp.]